MGENVWDFRKRLTLLLASAVIIAVVFFIFKVLFYYVWPFLLAFCFAVLLQKPIVGLAKLLREKKMLAASIVVTMVTLIILSVLLYVGYMAFRELKDFIANFDENINSLDGQFSGRNLGRSSPPGEMCSAAYQARDGSPARLFRRVRKTGIIRAAISEIKNENENRRQQIMLMQEERELVVEYGRKMSTDRLSTGTSGNISVCNAEKGLMAISPSGMDYFSTTPEDVVITDLEANIVDGVRKPSSEWALHTAFYRHKPHARAVVHTHSMYCTTFAVLGQPLRAVHYAIGDTGAATVPCAPFRLFGTAELAEAAIEACGGSDAVLLGNHGLVACGRDLKSAYGLACNLEYVAELQYRTMCIGTPNILTDEQMAEVMERFRSYGQPGSGKAGY